MCIHKHRCLIKQRILLFQAGCQWPHGYHSASKIEFLESQIQNDLEPHGVMICEWTNSRSDWSYARFCRKSGPAIVCGKQLLTTLSAATGSVLGQGLISSKGSFHSVVHTKRSRTLFCAIGLQPQWVQLLGQFQPPCALWLSCLATWGSQCFLAVLTHQAIKSADRKEKVIHPGTDRSRMWNSSKLLLVVFAPQADCAVKIGKVSSSEKISAGRDPRDFKGL